MSLIQFAAVFSTATLMACAPVTESAADATNLDGSVAKITADATAQTTPKIVNTLPSDAEVDVAVSGAIQAVFDKDLSSNTVTAASVVLTGPNNAAIESNVTYANRTITLTPVDRLPGNALMSATIKSTVTDSDGNRLDTDIVWTFTTGYGTDIVHGSKEFSVSRTAFGDKFVGGTPPSATLLVRKRTEDRAIVEFDVQRFPSDVASAQLDFHSQTETPDNGSTRIDIFRFDGNGIADLADFDAGVLFTSEWGANTSDRKPHTIDITEVLEDARQRGIRYLGLAFRARDLVNPFQLIPSQGNPDQAPRLTVTY